MVTAPGDGRESGHARRHAVNLDSSRTACQAFRSGMKETFFPEDPFRQSIVGGKTKARTVAEYFLPVLEWAPQYDIEKFKYDVLAGVTIASLAIPQGISYARLANLPPIVGLYSSFVPPLVYAIFGSSKNLAVGSLAAVSLLLASMIGEQVSPSDDPELYLHLFFTAAFLTGLFQTAFGIFRLGILVDFLSRSTITGFMSGTAIIIILQQLKGLFGLQHFTHRTDVVSVVRSLISQSHEWRWQSTVLGIIFLTFLLLTRHLKNKKPELFWVSAMSPLVIVITGGVFAYLTNAEEHGIRTVGPLKKGLNPISIGDLQLKGQHLPAILKAAFISGLLALAEGIAVGRSLAMVKNEQIDGNKEMIAFGMMNIAGSFTSCYITSGPFSKSAVNYNAGCKTAMSNVVMSVCMMLVLLFLAPLFSHTPIVALSAIITVAMIGLVEYEEAFRLLRLDQFDFCVCMAAFLGVVFVSMDVGLVLSVGLSVIRALLYIARPSTYKLGQVEESCMYRDVEQYPDTCGVSGILLLKLSSAIYFANATYLRERIRRWVEEETSIVTSKENGDLQFLILDIGGVTSIDKTGVDMLHEIRDNLDEKGIKLVLADPRVEVTEKLVVSKLIEKIGRNWVFLSVSDAVAACSFSLREGSRTDPLLSQQALPL